MCNMCNAPNGCVTECETVSRSKNDTPSAKCIPQVYLIEIKDRIASVSLERIANPEKSFFRFGLTEF